jgi:F0F1-type ATP synthase, subunit a
MKRVFRLITVLLVFIADSLQVTPCMAQDPELVRKIDTIVVEKEKKFDAKSFIFGHIGDSYECHITEINGKPICVPLPIIVKSKERGWFVFSSHKVCELVQGETYKGFFIQPKGSEKYAGKVVEFDSKGEVVRPFDMSFTKNALGLFVCVTFMLAFFLPAAAKYKKNPYAKPSKYQGLVEWLVYKVVDGIIKPSVGPKYQKFAPYLLTVFFFIFFNNLFGLIPFFPFGANTTGNLAITMVLALCTYVATNVFGNRHYWKDIFWPDVPVYLKAPLPIMPVIELISTITKPFALMVRLFANIMAGHIIIMVLMAIIFILGGLYGAGVGSGVSVVSISMTLFMMALELLVAYIQAYVFTMLSSIFIGLAQVEPETNTK